MKKKLLIVNKNQFGYHIDTYYYCKYLSSIYDITYVCFDDGLEKIDLENIEVVYAKSQGSYLKRAFLFYQLIFSFYRKLKPNAVFVKYFLGCSLLLTLIKRSITIVDIRTASVAESRKKRRKEDLILKKELKLFKHITIISEGLRKKLNLKNALIIPLGAVKISSREKYYDKIRLLYVGTFENRNIADTINGFAKFVMEGNKDISYEIVGFGNINDEELIKKTIVDNSLEKYVFFRGRVKVENLNEYFDRNNVGVAYVPMTDYFELQPPTKIFEYAMSGLITIATKTSINKTLINQYNGVTCVDNPDGFYKALKEVNKKFKEFKYDDITRSLESYHWEKIVLGKLLVNLKSIEG